MRDITRSLILIVLVLLIPILPFALFGDAMESWFVGLTEESMTTSSTVVFSLAALIGDILLPVPSSVVCTFVGNQLGWLAGTIVCWVGLTVGACCGYGLAAWGGPPLARRFADEAALSKSHLLAQSLGASLIVLTRAVPVLSEATVLWLGMQRAGLRRILLPLAVSNLAISTAYAALGEWAGKQGWLTIALVIAAGAPLLLWWEVRRRLNLLENKDTEEGTESSLG